MRRVPRLLILAVAACSTLGLAACSSSSDSAVDGVAWTDSVCGATLTVTDAWSTAPNISFTDPKAVPVITDFLGTVSVAAQSSLDSLHKLGPSPVDGGDAAVAQLTTALTTVKTSFDTARTRLGTVDKSNPTAIEATLKEALSPLNDALKTQGSGLEGTAALRDAGAKAPNCQKLAAATQG